MKKENMFLYEVSYNSIVKGHLTLSQIQQAYGLPENTRVDIVSRWNAENKHVGGNIVQIIDPAFEKKHPFKNAR
jgi:hypothetical protein